MWILGVLLIGGVLGRSGIPRGRLLFSAKGSGKRMFRWSLGPTSLNRVQPIRREICSLRNLGGRYILER
jgi:hypothetical protein